MRGEPDPQLAMLSSVSTEDPIPPDHPISKIRVAVEAVLADLDETFDGMLNVRGGGRRSVPPEVLLKATALMALYSIRSERAFCERLNYHLWFKWFLDMRIDQPAFDPTTFTKNRLARPGPIASLRVLGALLRRWDVVEGVGVAQELQTQRRAANRPAGGTQRRGALARPTPH
jgi:transposase